MPGVLCRSVSGTIVDERGSMPDVEALRAIESVRRDTGGKLLGKPDGGCPVMLQSVYICYCYPELLKELAKNDSCASTNLGSSARITTKGCMHGPFRG